jgi:hypothetical protein
MHMRGRECCSRHGGEKSRRAVQCAPKPSPLGDGDARLGAANCSNAAGSCPSAATADGPMSRTTTPHAASTLPEKAGLTSGCVSKISCRMRRQYLVSALSALACQVLSGSRMAGLEKPTAPAFQDGGFGSSYLPRNCRLPCAEPGRPRLPQTALKRRPLTVP